MGMKRLEGKPITCSACGQAGHTLVKDSEGNYHHQSKAFCESMKRSNPKTRQVALPTMEEIRKFARPIKKGV